MSDSAAPRIKYEPLLDFLSDAVVIVDGDGVILYANRAASEMFGAPVSRLIAQPFGFPVTVGEHSELDIHRADSPQVLGEMRVSDIEWNGVPAKIAFIRDLTERIRLAEETGRRKALEEERARVLEANRNLEVLVEAGEVLAGPDGLRKNLPRFLHALVPRLCDAAAIVLFAAPSLTFIEEHTGEDSGIRPGWSEASQPSLNSSDTPGEDQPAVLSLQFSGTEVGHLMLRGLRSEDGTGNMLETLRNRLQAEIGEEILSGRVRAEIEMRDRFLAKISHEIRNSVQILSGWVDFLGSLEPQGDLAEALRAFDNSALMLTRLTDDMMDLARILNGQLSIDKRNLALHQVIQDVVAAARPQAEEAGIEMRLAVPPEDVSYEGDEARLHQAIGNLVRNAVKYTPEGGKVTVALETAPEALLIEVRDTGEGIGGGELGTLFNAFQQGKAGHSRSGGLGLGLTIAREVIALHGGTIEVESNGEGQGACFRISLPNH